MNKSQHMRVMNELCKIMNIPDKNKNHFKFLYELDVLTKISEHRNNASQQIKKKLKGMTTPF